jgi:hypothetical protein
VVPRRIRLTEHALFQADRRRIPVEVIPRAIAERHARRRRNPGQADWRVQLGRIVVLYDWPVGDDQDAALVRTVWRL